MEHTLVADKLSIGDSLFLILLGRCCCLRLHLFVSITATIFSSHGLSLLSLLLFLVGRLEFVADIFWSGQKAHDKEG